MSALLQRVALCLPTVASHTRLAARGLSTAPRPGPGGDILEKTIQSKLTDIQSAGTWKSERIITSAQGADIEVAGAHCSPVLNFCANNYLGLSNHPALSQAAIEAIKTHGYGLSSVRFICGTQDLHKQLEHKISEFHQTEDTILYPSCFDANAGLFEALLGAEDAVISDELNHASIIDGIRLSKAQRFRYKHLDLVDLDNKLSEATKANARIKLVVTDGVFSMDGDIAPLNGIIQVARKHGAFVFVDEAHATGFVGATGRGTAEYCDVMGQVDIINSTLGKAMGGATGGYTTGRGSVVSLLRQKSRPYLFSNTLAPSVVGASLAAFDLITSSTSLRDKLEENTRYFREKISSIGLTVHPGVHPIVPIMLGDATLAGTMAARMLDHGVYVIAFSYPVVPKGQARIRVQVSAAHEKFHLDKAVEAFALVAEELGIIKGDECETVENLEVA